MKERVRLVKKGSEPTQKVEPPKRQETAKEMEARLRQEWMKERKADSRSDPRTAFRKLFIN